MSIWFWLKWKNHQIVNHCFYYLMMPIFLSRFSISNKRIQKKESLKSKKDFFFFFFFFLKGSLIWIFFKFKTIGFNLIIEYWSMQYSIRDFFSTLSIQVWLKKIEQSILRFSTFRYFLKIWIFKFCKTYIWMHIFDWWLIGI